MSRILKQRLSMHARLGKGGYLCCYFILDDGDVIGSKTVRCEKRGTPEKITYALGDELFDTAEKFREAYERHLRDVAWDAAAPRSEAKHA